MASSSLPLRSMKVWLGPLTMTSLISGSASNSSSGPRPSNSSTSTFSSANCSRRLRVILSSASTSEMIGRNSSASSSLLSIAAASGSTRSSRRGSTCSLILCTEASKPSALWFAASPLWFWRAVRRSIAAPVGAASPSLSGESDSSGGNWSPPGTSAASSEGFPPGPPFIGLATPKLGRDAPIPLRLPKALIQSHPSKSRTGRGE